MPPKKAAAPAPAAPAKLASRSQPKRKAQDALEAPAAKRPSSSRAKSVVSSTTKAVNGVKSSRAAKPKPTVNGIARNASKGPSAVVSKHGRKRKADTSVEPKAATKQPRIIKGLPVINARSTQRLNIFVMGEGGMGELGLGAEKTAKNVKRPRLNPLLKAENVGVVQIAVGGMHCAALTHDNQILTWGVNDQGACGRDTTWDGGLRDVNDDDSAASDESDDESGLNPNEATPTAIPAATFDDPNVKFVQVAAGDSMTFALTDTGLVYGWGTFRSNEGILGFTESIFVQRTPRRIEELKKIKHIVCGANHVLALDEKGRVFAWGSGQQCQLGRRVVERTRSAGLVPREFGLKKNITQIAAGSYHSFAIDRTGNVHSWGLNNYGECGIFENAGADDAVIAKPRIVDSLADYSIKCIKGGSHHSVAVSEEGRCLVWGRADGAQLGIAIADLPDEDLVRDATGRPRILNKPAVVPGITCTYATAESDHTIAITTSGKAYSWGFNGNYQIGQGPELDEVAVATLIDNTAVRDKTLNWAGCGGQFSVLTAVADAQPLVNGTH